MASSVETVMTEIAAEMGATAYTFYGRSEEARHGDCPKITWVEDDDDGWEPPTQQFDRASETCIVRLVPVDIHLWGASVEDSETLLHSIIAAIVTVDTRIAFTPRPSRKKGEARTTKGHKRVLSLYLKIPVQRDELTVGEIDTIEATGSASGDGGDTYEIGVVAEASA